MAWGWWKRRRRRWWRGLWRRRRFARRRPRRPARRPRRRRVRRRRRWRRGRLRRRVYNRRRRIRRKRRRQKLTIRQWQPDKRRICRIKGYLPALIYGDGTFSKNYTSHLEDRISKGPFGGGHGTARMSLKVLYDDHLKGLNIWTYSNKDLELTRYLHTTITFYRHPDTDFIAVYNRKTPLGGNRYTAPSLHPGNMMLQRQKILIPSFKTKPRGSGKIRVVIKPPTLLVDKWYFQKDICDVTLFNLNITACSLRFPFCSPQTNNPCVTFQVLHSVYDKALGINTFGTKDTSETEQKENIKNWLTKALNTAGFTVLNTFRTEGIYSHPQLKKPPEVNNKPNAQQYFAPLDSLWGDKIYVNSNVNPPQTETTIPGILAENAYTYYQKAKQDTIKKHLGAMAHCHLTGIFNPALLTQGRLSPEFFGLYKEIIYNPYDDKGKGNKIWIDPLTKPDNIFDARSKVELEDMPLWMACFGYNDWCKKELNNWGLEVEYRVLLRCPYTYPKLYNDANPNYGYVPISYNFSAGKTVEGDLYVPIMWRTKWYPTMYNQYPVLEDLAMSGPFAPKEKIPSSTLTVKYKAKFIFGGNPISEQIVKDPCTQPTYEIPGGGTLPRRIQVINPEYIGPHYSFKSFDIRRGYFSAKSVKRVSEQSDITEFIFSGPKKPRIDQDRYQEAEEHSDSRLREEKPWESSQETESEAQEEEIQETNIQLQLQHQLKEQLQLRRGIQCLFEQLTKTQQGVHINPSLV
nr:MAG: ORF1 [Torque teno virus]